MADSSQLTLEGAKVEADAAQTRMALSVMHLFQTGFFPTATTPKSEYDAHEADFSGYAAASIATWNDPVLAGTGWMVYAPTQTFAFDSGSGDVGNSIGGYWLETAGGKVISFTLFDGPEGVSADGMAIIRTPTLIYRAGL